MAQLFRKPLFTWSNQVQIGDKTFKLHLHVVMRCRRSHSRSKYVGFPSVPFTSIAEQSQFKVIPVRIGSCDLLAFFIINSASSLQSGNINSEAEMRNWNSWRCNTVAFLSGPPVNTCTEKGWRLQATQQGTTAIQLSSASTTTTVVFKS